MFCHVRARGALPVNIVNCRADATVPRIREIRRRAFSERAFQRRTLTEQRAVSSRGSIFLGAWRTQDRSLKLSGNDWQLIYDADQGSWSSRSYQRSGCHENDCADSRGDRRKAFADATLAGGKPSVVTVRPFHPFVTLWVPLCTLRLPLLPLAAPPRLETGIISTLPWLRSGRYGGGRLRYRSCVNLILLTRDGRRNSVG